MKHHPRLIAMAACFAALTISLSSCDTSPVAASVGSHQIKQTALNAELRTLAGNHAYVTAYDSANAQTSGATIEGYSSGAYNKTWVASVLTDMITALAVRDHLAATGKLPGPGVVATARAVNEIVTPGWDSMPASYREEATQRLADISVVSSLSSPISSYQLDYAQRISNFYSQVCILQASAATRASAEVIAAAPLSGDAPVCLDHTAVEALPAAVQTQVTQIAVGDVSAPVKTSFGYEVVQVVSRKVIPFDRSVAKVISAAILKLEDAPNSGVDAITAEAHIHVNPSFGVWKSGAVAPPSQAALG